MDCSELKITIRSLVVSNPKGIPLTPDRLAKDYEQQIGLPLPLCGYRNLEELLRAMPDVVRLYSRGGQVLIDAVFHARTEHISQFVSSARTSDDASLSHISGYVVPADIARNITIIALHQPGIALSRLQERYKSRFGVDLIPGKYNFDSVASMLESVESDEESLLRLGRRLNGDHEIYPTGAAQKLRFQVQQLPHQYKEKVVKVVQTNEGLDVLTLCEKYRACYGEPLGFQRYHYRDVRQLVLDIPELVLVDTENNIQLVYTKHFEDSTGRLQLANITNVASSVHQYSKELETLRQLLLLYPNGITEQKIDSEIPRFMDVNQADKVTNFVKICGGVKQLASQYSHVITCCVPPQSDTEVFLAVNKHQPEISLLQPGAADRVKRQKPLSGLRWALPGDAIGPNFSIPNEQVLPYASRPMRVVVSHVQSPNYFHIIWFGPDTSNQLHKLNNCIDAFVKSPDSKRYRFPHGMLSRGQVCLARKGESEYLRGTVVSVVSDDSVLVRFLDFGGELTVNVKHILAMPKRFAELPAQAILCRLAHVVPVGDPESSWTDAATELLNEEVFNKEDVTALPAYGQWASAPDLPVPVGLHTPTARITLLMIKKKLAKYNCVPPL